MDTQTHHAGPLLTRAGAVAAQGSDTGVAWHYGDPTREQRALESGAAVTDLSNRGVLRVSGSDRRSWLHSLTSQHLLELAPGISRESLVLSPHGHVEHALHLVDDGETMWITVEPGTAPALLDWLRRMQFMLRVDVADVSDQWAVVGLVAAEGAPVPVGLRVPDDGPPGWQDPWPNGSASEGPSSGGPSSEGWDRYSAVPHGEHPGLGRPWREVLIPRAGFAAAIGELPLAGSWAAEALRVAAWRPRLGNETDHRTIPHELDWLRSAVHLDKGCYRGQETVARVHNLGRPPRRLVLLHLDGSEHVLPERTTPVLLGERSVGHVTTAVRHHELGPVALALVKRSLPLDAVLTVGGIAAAQEAVVAP